MKRVISFWQQHETLIMRARAEKQMQILQKIKKKQLHTQDKVIRGIDETGKEGDETDVVIDMRIEDGVVKTYLQNKKEPIRGYSDIETIWVTAYYKRLLHIYIRNFKAMSLWGKIITILSAPYHYRILPEWFEHIFSMNKALLEEEYWLPVVKELRRVLKGKLNQSIIDAFILVVEYDAAYRLPLQDILMEYKKDQPIRKEVMRLFNLLIERTVPPHSKEKWEKWKPMLKIALLIKGKFIKSILDSIDLNKIALSKEEIYHVSLFNIYNIRGMNWEAKKAYLQANYGDKQ